MATPQPYVQLAFSTDPTDLADEAIEYLQGQWPDWEPDEADPMVVYIEALAPMAANAAQIASNMPPAALIALAALWGITYQPGVPASATATFTVQDADGPYDIDLGAEIDISGVAFQTTADLTIPAGETTGSVPISANLAGEFANGFDGTDWAPIDLPIYVTDMTLEADTSGGVDQQDDQGLLDTIALDQRLRSRSLITLNDIESAAVTTAGITRAVAVADEAHPRDITVYVTDGEGMPVDSTIKDDLSATYDKTRMVNAQIVVADGAYTTVSVTYEALALPDVDADNLLAMINGRLGIELSPSGWGAPSSGNSPSPMTWINQPVVHLNRIIGVISGVVGVDYVVSCSISADSVAELSASLATGAAITSLPVTALVNAIPSGATLTLDDGAGHTQTWTTSAAAAVGATSIAVASQTPNFAYPAASTKIGGAVTGDLTMNGNAAGALPLAGTFTGTIDSATS